MKTSVSLSLFDAPEGAPVLFSNNIDQNIPYIKELGYDGIDLFIGDPVSEVSKHAAKLLKQYNLGVSVVMPAALAGQGLFLSHKDPEVRKEILIRMRTIIEYASELGANVPLGLVRGSIHGGETNEEVLDRFTLTTEQLLPHSERYGVCLLVEPINRYEINTLNGCNETCDFIKRTGLPLYMMPDTFHMNIEDVSIQKSLFYCREFIKHIHFLDSNRLAPGMGHTDMVGIYKALKDIGYDGYLGLEALPKPDEKTCAEKGIEFFEKIGLKK